MRRIEEFIGVPGCCHRAGFRLAIANDARHDQVGIVKSRAKGMGKGVSELAAFVNGSGSFGSHMAWNASGKRKLLEELAHALGIHRDIRVHLAVGSFQIAVCHDPGPSMPGPDDIDHVQVVGPDDTI